MTAPVQIDRSKVKLGVTPTLWWNDDFPSIDIEATFEQCVSEMALAGFEGCSVGHKYPKDPAVLRAALELRGLRVSEPWTSTYFTAHEMEETTLATFASSLEFIKAMGGTTWWSPSSAEPSTRCQWPSSPTDPCSTTSSGMPSARG